MVVGIEYWCSELQKRLKISGGRTWQVAAFPRGWTGQDRFAGGAFVRCEVSSNGFSAKLLPRGRVMRVF